ncbi:MAG: S49 family peptidase [Proteobacteria bacterium]|nr:S49 family peptidase [Pseudomonadota bacterium]
MNKTILSKLINTPLMIAAGKLDAILSAKDIDVSLQGGMFKPNKAPQRIGVITVYGVLTHRSSGFDTFFGLSSYTQIRNTFRMAISDDSIDAILFDIDSPGGEASGVFDLVDEIYSARGKKPIYAIANESAYSAAYAIASSADKVFLSRTASVGSVGVIAVHVDQSGFDEQRGLKYTAIFSGDRKNDFSSHNPLSDEAIKTAQKSVNKTYDLFVQTVARNRSLSPKQVIDTQAGIFDGHDAIKSGLADDVLSWDQAIQTLSGGTITMSGSKNLKQDLTNLFKETSDEEVKLGLAQLGYIPKTDVPDTDKIKEEGKATGKNEAMTYAKEIIGLCDLAGMLKMSVSLIEKNVSIEDARRTILEAKAAESGKNEIISTVGATGTGEINPLIKDAMRRKEA